MCGIAGIYGARYEEIGKMLGRLEHRGPDNIQHELFHDDRLALGHTRLTIIDLHNRSNQPFRSRCGKYFLTFNGEIYNFKALKAQLECSGQTFETESDTEVLLYWLIKFGKDGIEKLDGMFAFAFYDTEEKRLLCARDHLGEKPFFYHSALGSGSQSFLFASEIKALLTIISPSSISKEALINYVRFLYVPAPQTLFENINELPPGHALEVDLVKNSIQISRYYNLAKGSFDKYQDLSYRDTVDAFFNVMSRTMETRMISDVPVAMLLSGGLDSNAMLGFIKDLGLGDKIHPYTAAYRGANLVGGGDESKLALAALDYHNIEGKVLEFHRDFDLDNSVNKITNTFDQPYGNSTALIACRLFEKVSTHCRVALVGDGGDEIMSGYPRHKAVNYKRHFDNLPGPITRLVLNTLNKFPEDGRLSLVKRRARNFLESSTESLAEAFLNWSSYSRSSQISTFLNEPDVETTFFLETRNLFNENENDPLRAASLVDLVSWIPYNLLHGADTTSMASSLEVRTPFLAKELVELTLNLNSRHKVSYRRNKPILADSVAHLIPKEISRQPKRGFNPPLQSMMTSSINEMKRVITDKNSPVFSHLSYDAIQGEFNDFAARRRDNSPFLWGMLVLNSWIQKNNL